MSTRFLILLCCAVICFCVGCKPKDAANASTPSKPEVADKDRPPLRLLLIEQPPALKEVIQLRWASVSEQRLEFQTALINDLDMSKPAAADLIIAPTMLLGSFVERDWIRELPSEIVSRYDATVVGEQEAVPMADHVVRSVKYAKRTYAAPLRNSLSLVGFDSDVDIESLKAGNTSKSRMTEDDLEIDWNRLRVARPAENVFAEPDVVDQFLMIASSNRQNAYEGSLLFKLVDCSSRVSEPWMVESAKQLRELYADGVEDRLLCSLGWSWSNDGRRWFIPNVNQKADASEAIEEQQGLIRSVIDAGKGSMVCLSSTTRQSSKSIFFMKWLYEPGQVDAFGSLWRSEVSEVVTQAAMRSSYSLVSMQAGKSDDIPIAFQIDGGLQYRRELKQSLELIMNDAQVDVLQELERCRQRMNTLTDQLGRDHQQDSLERSLGLRD